MVGKRFHIATILHGPDVDRRRFFQNASISRL